MATYFVASGGSNTSPYDTWAKAATSLATALAAATTAGDVVVIQYNAVPSGDAELAADTTYTFAGDIWLISASNDGGSAYTPTAMGTANWIGNSTTNRFVAFAGNDRRAYVWGLTLRTAGSTADRIDLNNSAGGQFTYDNCYLWAGNTASSDGIRFNAAITNYTSLIGCTLRMGATGATINTMGTVDMIGGSISSAGSTPTILFSVTSAGILNVVGADLSLVTGTLIGNAQASAAFTFDRCKFGAGVTVLGSQTSNPTRGSPWAWVSDCSSGDTHGLFGYYDGTGSVVSDTGIYFTSGAAAQSWKIVTNSNCTATNPFVTPWVDLYNTGTSAITPYFEILRDGSTTAYKDHEVWAEFSAKVTSGSTVATSSSDVATLVNRATLNGSNQAAGAGTGSWTGEAGSAWSGKCDSGSSITPAESGAIRGRIVVAGSSITIYVDPQIRT